MSPAVTARPPAADSFHQPALRFPEATDGAAVHQLITACSPLDRNSLYCNLLHCTHFSRTSVLAEDSDETVGFISAYALPGDPTSLFVWQVAVAARLRGRGLGLAMLHHILARPASRRFRFLITSVTPTNHASARMFHKLAVSLGANVERQPWLDRDTHLMGSHDSEALLRIGPFTRPPAAPAVPRTAPASTVNA